MKQTKEIKLAYVAGFLDGEGCIRINKRNFSEISLDISQIVTIVTSN